MVDNDDKRDDTYLEIVDVDDLNPIDAPITSPSQLTTKPSPEKPIEIMSKKSKKPLITKLVIVLIILILASVAAYSFLHSQQGKDISSNIRSNITSSAPDATKLTAKDLVAKAKAVVKGDAKETLLSTDSTPYNVFQAPVYQPTGYQFSVSPSTDVGFGSYGTKNTVTTDLAAIQKVLTDNTLHETVLQAASDTAPYAGRYESHDIICSVGTDIPYNEPATSTHADVILGCANKSDYISKAAMLRTYFIVYASQTKTDTTHLVLGTATTKDSKTPGYIIETVPISSSEYGSAGGFAGLFYTTPDSTLYYFTGTQSEVGCSAYNSDDLKKAYLGEPCYAAGNDAATVQL